MSELASQYFDEVIRLLERVRTEERDGIERAGALLADAAADGRKIFAFGCSHSSLPVQDIVYRAGGLMLVNPIYGPGIEALTTRPATLGSAMEKLSGFAQAILDSSPIEAGDVLIVVSVSGRNAVPIEMAQVAKDKGVTVIGVTSHEYTDSVESRHPSGRKMKDFCDLVLDNKAAKGDAVLQHPQVPQRFTPASGVTSTALLHAIVATAVGNLADRGVPPPVFLAANVDGGAEWNADLLAANADRIFYL